MGENAKRSKGENGFKCKKSKSENGKQMGDKWVENA